jgi:hypothetical protein
MRGLVASRALASLASALFRYFSEISIMMMLRVMAGVQKLSVTVRCPGIAVIRGQHVKLPCVPSTVLLRKS